MEALLFLFIIINVTGVALGNYDIVRFALERFVLGHPLRVVVLCFGEYFVTNYYSTSR